MMKSLPLALASSLAALALSGCMVGPDYEAPKIAVPQNYTYCDGCDLSKRAGLDEATLAKWWQLFNDPQLDALVNEVLADNIGLDLARSRIREARYRLAGAKAELFPTIGALATANHTKLSQNSGLSSLAGAFGGGSGGAPGGGASAGIAAPGRSISTFTSGFDASWELDLFGAGRRKREAAAAALEAETWSGRDTQVSLVAEAANAYFTLREINARRELVDELIEVRKRARAVAEAKVASGLLPKSALEAPASAVEQAIAARAQLKDAARSVRVGLAILLGKPVGALPKGLAQSGAGVERALFEIPPGLPSDLLDRRPDLRAAERRLAAATARIGVAEAARLPSFSLTGVAELVSTTLAKLISDRSIQTVVQGKLGAPLIDFGRGAAASGVAREQAKQAELAYRQRVLVALGDVNRSLSAIASTDAQTAAGMRIAENTARKERAAQAGYKAGLTDFAPVAQSAEATLAARQALLNSQLASLRGRVALFKALGGGWSVKPD